ncbi:MAG: hypothetical protein DMG32_07195 [Acidobacteria bacterium]|nr:MAG: hypothetical protein DMG32_07195 [Acidobacteriota bacterium]
MLNKVARFAPELLAAGEESLMCFALSKVCSPGRAAITGVPNARRFCARWGEPALGTRKDSPRAVPSLLPQAVPEAALP